MSGSRAVVADGGNPFPPNQVSASYARLQCAHTASAVTRALRRQAAKQQEAARIVGYDALLLETRLLRKDIERVSSLAGQIERQQLALGLRLFALRER